MKQEIKYNMKYIHVILLFLIKDMTLQTTRGRRNHSINAAGTISYPCAINMGLVAHIDKINFI